jgi:hypothetical protein
MFKMSLRSLLDNIEKSFETSFSSTAILNQNPL